jgi:enamine deaminase RidA (YjgF/YER057c/UK114 family)
MNVEAKLKEMGLELPGVSRPVGSYVPAVRSGALLFLSGHGPYRDGKRAYTGKLGQEYTVQEGYEAARLVALNCLATVKDALGDLDRVKRVVKVLGFVSSSEGFVEQPQVINGCSDLLVELYGEVGRHARSAIGVAELPGGMPVEIEMVLEVE